LTASSFYRNPSDEGSFYIFRHIKAAALLRL
jgi:hypothetical protein